MDNASDSLNSRTPSGSQKRSDALLGRARSFLFATPRFELGIALAFLVLQLLGVLFQDSDITLAVFTDAALKAILAYVVVVVFRTNKYIHSLDRNTSRLDDAAARLGRALGALEKIESSNASILSGFQNLKGDSEQFQKFQARWTSWRGRLPELAEEKAWNKIMEVYLEKEGASIENGRIETTSEVYTSLLERIGEILGTHYREEGETTTDEPLVRRFQLSGMLPDEFYNGHQIEYTSIDSKPIFLAHSWERYTDFYDKPSHPVRRCLLLRAPEVAETRLGALYTLGDLESLTETHIKPRSHSATKVNDEMMARRLLRMNWQMNKRALSDTGSNSLEVLKEVVGLETYEYYPMLSLSERRRCPPGYRLLLEEYANFFHHEAAKDALFYVVDEECIQWLMSQGSFTQIFKAGHIPEIALFGKICGGADLPERWSLGILGQWVPFTRKMNINLLTGNESDQLARSIEFILRPSSADDPGPLESPRTILSLLDEKDTRPNSATNSDAQ